MQEKFTPGPWKIVGEQRDGLPAPFGEIRIDGNRNSEKIATIVRSGTAVGGSAEQPANARLIAASPTLFRLCFEMSLYLEQDDSPESAEILHEYQELVQSIRDPN